MKKKRDEAKKTKKKNKKKQQAKLLENNLKECIFDNTALHCNNSLLLLAILPNQNRKVEINLHIPELSNKLRRPIRVQLQYDFHIEQNQESDVTRVFFESNANRVHYDHQIEEVDEEPERE